MTRKRRFFGLTTAVIAIQAFTFYLPSEAFTVSSPTRKSPCNRRILRTSIQRVLELRQQKHNKLEDVIMKTESASTAPPSLPLSNRRKRKNYRMRLFAWISRPSVEVVSALAVLLSVLLVALGTLDNLDPLTEECIYNASLALNIMFALDFFVRWYAAGQFKVIYLTKPLAVIDIFVILIPLALDVVLPLLDSANLLEGGSFLYGLQTSAGLQNFLLLRVLRLRRVLTDIGTFRRFAGALGLKSKDVRPYQLQLARVLLSIFTLLSVASGLIYTAEHDVNPGIPDYFSALYFGLTTLTTVGFGDITPVTVQGKFVVCASIIAGVAVIPAQAAKLFEAFAAFQREKEQELSPILTPKMARQMIRQDMKGSTAAPVKYNLTDGKGPGGTPIDEPIKEWVEAGQRSDNTSIDPSLTCRTCTAAHHWSDAVFCWSCGSQLTSSDGTRMKE
eukprot:scaffold32070_cov203-Amphora_coffeaeformis.AAC.1